MLYSPPTPETFTNSGRQMVVNSFNDSSLKRLEESLGQGVGTGGYLFSFANHCLLVGTSTFITHKACEALDVPDMMSAIKRYLVPTVTDLAAVLQVKRPTIYAWSSGTQPPRDENLERIEQLYDLALNAREILDYVPSKELQTLYQMRLGKLLTGRVIVTSTVTAELETIRNLRNARASATQPTKKLSLKARAAEMGRLPGRSPDREEYINLLTGKTSRDNDE